MKKLSWLILPILLLMSCRSTVLKVKTSEFIEMCQKKGEKITAPYTYDVYEAIYPYCSYYKDSLHKDSDYIDFGLNFNWEDCVQKPFEYQEMAIIEFYSKDTTKHQVFFVSYIYSPPSNWRDEKEKCKERCQEKCKEKCIGKCKDKCIGKCKEKCIEKCNQESIEGNIERCIEGCQEGCKEECDEGCQEECKEECKGGCKEGCKGECKDTDYCRYKCKVKHDQNKNSECKCECKIKRKIKINKTTRNDYKYAKPLANDPAAKKTLEYFLRYSSLLNKDSMMIKDNALIYSGYYLDGDTMFSQGDTKRVLHLEQKFEYRKGKMKKRGKQNLILELQKEINPDTHLVCNQIINYASNQLGGDKPVIFEMASTLGVPAIVFRKKIPVKKVE
jgi:hypothetical protein